MTDLLVLLQQKSIRVGNTVLEVRTRVAFQFTKMEKKQNSRDYGNSDKQKNWQTIKYKSNKLDQDNLSIFLRIVNFLRFQNKYVKYRYLHA